MRFLVVFTHQTWPMHYFHGGVLARALINEGHEVLWLNCERTMPGCHAQWIVPSIAPLDICATCQDRTRWIRDMGITPRPMSEFLDDADRAAMALAMSCQDLAALASWTDQGTPVGDLSLSSPMSCARMLSIDDPDPSFLPMMQKAVAASIATHRAVRRIIAEEQVQRVIVHLGRMVAERVTLYLAEARGLPWFTYETGSRRNALRLFRQSTTYNRPWFRKRWQAFQDTPLSPADLAAIQDWFLLRRQSRKKAGILTYSPTQTSARILYEQLSLPHGAPIVALFTSSVDEMSALGNVVDADWRPVYADQYTFILEAIEWARQNSTFALVIRIHPNEGAKANHLGMAGHKSLAKYRDVFGRVSMPKNVRVVWPDAAVSSYTLMETSSAGLVWMSTAGLEMSAMGRPVVVGDNPSYRDAGFVTLCEGPGHLGEALDTALAKTQDERLSIAVAAHRFAFHFALRYVLDFPLVLDHGRMERISLGFSEPSELRFGRHDCLDRALNYLIHDLSPFPEAGEFNAGDERWERAGVLRLRAPDHTEPRSTPTLVGLQTAAHFEPIAAALGFSATDAPPLWDDLQRLHRSASAELVLVTVGELGPIMKAAFPGRVHLHVDAEARDQGEPIQGDVGGRPEDLCFRAGFASAVLILDVTGDDPRTFLRACREWLSPGGHLLLIERGNGRARAPERETRLTSSGAGSVLRALGLVDVVMRRLDDGSFATIGRLPGQNERKVQVVTHRDALAQALPPCRRTDDRITSADGQRVLLIKRGSSFSAFDDDLLPAQAALKASLQTALTDEELKPPRLMALVPPVVRRLLHVGCGQGTFGAALKSERPIVVVDGTEADRALANAADARLDRVFVGPLSQVLVEIPERTYDSVVLDGALSTFVDPTAMLRALRSKLKPEGTLVVSESNARSASRLLPLLSGHLEGRPGHVHDFTQTSLVDLLRDTGFDVLQMEAVPEALPEAQALYTALSSSGLTMQNLEAELNASEFLVVCQKRPEARERLTSIVMLAWNQIAYTKICIDTVLEHTHVPFELVLVDNGSHDGTPDYFRELKARYPNVKLQLNRKNLGFSKGCNQGLAMANGDYICFLSNDTLVTEGWLDRMQWWIELEPNLGLVGPVSNRVAGVQKIEVDYDEDGMTPEAIAGMQVFASRWCKAHKGESVQLNRIIGLCLLLKREVVDRIGGFDTCFGTGNFEDDDLCFRVRVAGYRVAVARDVFIHHYGSKTFEGNKVDYSATMGRNMDRFLKKWGFERTEDGYRASGLSEITYDRARHYAPFGAEEGFRADIRPVTVVEAALRNVLVMPPYGEDEQLMELVKLIDEVKRDGLAFWLRCPAYEAANTQATLEAICRGAGLAVAPDVLLVDAPLAAEREAGLYVAATAIYVDEEWADSDLAVRRAMDCGVTVLRGPDELRRFAAL